MLTTDTVPVISGRSFGTVNPEKSVGRANFSFKDQLSASIRYSLAPDHFLEWTQGSGVDPGIVRLNVETLLDTALSPFEDAVFPIHERLNWQIRRFGREARDNLRGWWVSGRDPLNSWKPMEWGCFKPDAPIRSNEKGKLVKYEHPVKTPTRAFFLRVTWKIGLNIAIFAGKETEYEQRILQAYSRTQNTTESTQASQTEAKGCGVSSQVSSTGDRDGIAIPSRTRRMASGDEWEKSQIPSGFLELEDREFWQWALCTKIPLTITEGAKKAGCLLTLGLCALALPGIFNGYRKESGLIPELEVFATGDRQIHICFDFETKPKTVQNVNIAIAKLGKLLVNQGAKVNVINLPGLEKGVDDFVLAHGADAFDDLYSSSQDLDYWQAQKLWALTYTPTIILNQRYLGELPFPKSGLACIKSPKGTGKTQSLEPLIQEATRIGRKVIILTHRVQLGRALCDRLGLDWVEDLRESETKGLLGLGLCVDSLHFQSAARFNPQHWHGAILIIDEAEQVIWHALNSYTCHEDRVAILDNLRELVQKIATTGGLIIAQDADLSDVSVNYLRSIAAQLDETDYRPHNNILEPWLVVNEWHSPADSSQVYYYDTQSPDAILTRIDHLLTQGAVFVALDAQKVKGKYSSINLESLFQQKHPHLKVLRIDSQSVADPNHPAYGSIENLNEILPNYDLVLATPTIGTGVDIHLKGHFVAVVGIFQGVIPDAEARQALARVREPVPRYVWAASFGSAKIGNGSCNYREIINSKKKDVKWNINRLLEQDFDIDGGHDPITLRTWAKMAARVNVSLWHYRQELKHGLVREGHEIVVVTDDVGQILPTSVSKAIAVVLQHYYLHLLTLWRTFPQYLGYLAFCNSIAPSAVMAAILDDLRSGFLEFSGCEYLHKDHCQIAIASNAVELAQVRDANKQTEARAVVNAPDLSASEYQKLQNQRVKTTEERLSERKYQLQQRYPIPITPEIKIRDDEGWYPKLRLHYYLTYDPKIVRERDLKEWSGHLERGNGKVALQDVKLLTAQVELLRGLGIPGLLDPNREVRPTDPDVQRLVLLCRQCSRDIKDILNVTVSAKMTPIQVVQELLKKLGIKLACVGRDRLPNGKFAGSRVYQYVPENDGREEIFGLWNGKEEGADPPLDISNN